MVGAPALPVTVLGTGSTEITLNPLVALGHLYAQSPSLAAAIRLRCDQHEPRY
jgi:hypothetical protein